MAGIEFSETVPVLGTVTKFPAANAKIARKLSQQLAKKKEKEPTMKTGGLLYLKAGDGLLQDNH